MPKRGRKIPKSETPIGDKYLPAFSPDGKWIAYIGVEGEGLSYKNASLWVVPADGSKPSRNLTEKYDVHVDSSTINDMGSPETMPPTWSKDGKRLYFQTVLHGSTKLASISMNGMICGMRSVKAGWWVHSRLTGRRKNWHTSMGR